MELIELHTFFDFSKQFHAGMITTQVEICCIISLVGNSVWESMHNWSVCKLRRDFNDMQNLERKFLFLDFNDK